MAEEIKLTLKGKENLEQELSKRQTEIANEITNQIKEAKEQGDLSENAEYSAAREAQSKNNARIAEIEYILKNAIIVEEAEEGIVGYGRKVTVRETKSKKESTYEIVVSNEVDFLSNKISLDSPLGAAIKGLKVGDKAVVKAPVGDLTYKIVSID